MPLKTCFDIKTDICDQNQDKSRNPYVAKFQKGPKVLCIDPLEGPRGLVSFANFFTPTGASRQVWKGWKSSFCYVIHFVVPRRGSGRPTCGALSSAKAYPTRHRVPTNQPKLWGRIAQAHLPTKAAKNQLNCKSYWIKVPSDLQQD